MSGPENKEFAKQLRSPHGEFATEIGKFMERNNKAMLAQCLAEINFSDDKTILEIGPGNGSFVPEFFKRNINIQYTGIELSEEMFKSCKVINAELIQAGKSHFIHADILKLDLPENHFCVILGINVIYFFKPVEEFLIKLYKLLKPGGKLILGFRDKSSMQELPFVDDSFTLFDMHELSEILKNCGFNDVNFSTDVEDIKLIQGGKARMCNVCCLALKGKMA